MGYSSGLTSCDHVHRDYDPHANSQIQVGVLPEWMHVTGKVAWYVFQGPYSQLPVGWNDFWAKFRSASLEITGPPGDVYVCAPEEHRGDEQKLTTILWAPVRA